ncbi:STAS domain-containing protein [Pseudonocardia nematodicida]|uniref:Anti-sigma factor antagonist n=1 Tax=Pseudonocardia nematodicida TaxID=1206997 RepID=A0ABV1KGM6_9PSEU
MTGRTGDTGQVVPGWSVGTDGTGALRLEAVPHPSGPVLVHADGEVDTVTAPFLSGQLHEWVAAAPRVVLDLSRVTFLGSAGLAVLLDSHLWATRAGVAFQVVCGEARQVRRVLQVTGTLEHLDVLDRILPGTTAGERPPLFAVPEQDPPEV